MKIGVRFYRRYTVNGSVGLVRLSVFFAVFFRRQMNGFSCSARPYKLGNLFILTVQLNFETDCTDV